VALYAAVQALPGDSTSLQSGLPLRHQNENNSSQNLPRRSERPEDDRSGGISWRSLFSIAGRMIVFSILVFVSILAKNFIFERKPTKKKTVD